MIGTKLAHYDITGHLGSGGMGDVYQASDSRLGRTVAIKVLPEAFARDSERIARFEREARVLASLNHPHIAAIHGLEESDGRKFLVMELAAGETLAERIARGPLALDDALTIASQIAEGLEAAHEKGVIHRDLKPANIKVNPESQVKVLDFGLAKAFSEDTEGVNRSNSPTIMSRLATNAGVILGTAAYMSPEQAKGLNVDRRTDIFAFGCMLYEMLTGRQAFQGETVSDILADVLRAEPDWSRLPDNTPPRIRALLAKCLQKDRLWRLQSAGDARIEIRDIRNDPGIQVQPVAPTSALHGRERIMWVAALVVLAAVATMLALAYFRRPAAPAEIRAEITTPPTSDPISFAISPDGQKLVYVASANNISRLWLRLLDSSTAQPLADTDGAAYPFWSPDSRSVGFFAEGKLKRIEVRGGASQTITIASVGRGGTWGSDGTILFVTTTTNLHRVASTGGDPIPMTELEPRNSPQRFPSFLPDGRHFLFFIAGSAESQGVYLGSLDSSNTRRLTSADGAAIYAPNGWLVYPSQGALLARRFDVSRAELQGDPVTIADSIMLDTNFNIGAFSISSTGIVLYRSGAASQRQLAWFDRAGKQLETMGMLDESSIMATQLSPDGKRVAAQRTVQNNTDIWFFDANRMTRFTFDAGLDRFAQWSGDGTRIVFDSNRTGHRNLYAKPVDNSRPEELLLETDLDKASNDWSSDNRFILYNTPANLNKTGSDIWVLPLEGDRKPFVFVQTNFEERLAQFSPDVHWIAYQSNETGRYEIYIRPFPGPGAQTQVSIGGGIQTRWRHDGKELYYVAPNGKLVAVPIELKGSTLNAGAPVALFQTRLWGGGTNTNNGFQYDVSPDGRFLMNTATDDAAASPITLLLNWHPEKK